MREFRYKDTYHALLSPDIVSLLSAIHECKGEQSVFSVTNGETLEKLVEIARIQSTEASNKIEGIVTTSTRMKQLFEEKTTPKNRDEDEIMGYRDVLNTIHESNEYTN